MEPWMHQGCLVAYAGQLWYFQPEPTFERGWLYERRGHVGAPALAAHARVPLALLACPTQAERAQQAAIETEREARGTLVGPLPHPVVEWHDFELRELARRNAHI